jgi:hypothetical protein
MFVVVFLLLFLLGLGATNSTCVSDTVSLCLLTSANICEVIVVVHLKIDLYDRKQNTEGNSTKM